MILTKKSKLLFVGGFLALLFSFFFFATVSAQNSANKVKVHVFYGIGCPHCASLLSFLEELKKAHPTLEIQKHEVYQHNEERELFEKTAEKFQIEIEGVPTVFINADSVAGFSEEIAQSLKEKVEYCEAQECLDPLEGITLTTKTGEDKDMRKLTMPIVIGAAAVDAINPCAFAVLIILMTAALSIADKKRALKFGLAFACSIYISYFLMGLGLFSALQTAKLSNGFYLFVTVLAVLVGLLNVKDYFWYGKGFLMEVPLSWRPKMKKIIGSATSPWGAFLIGFAVSLFELPCTGGPYLVILGLLAKEMTRWAGVGYLVIYNLVFIAPLLILSFVIYRGLSTTEKLEKIRQEKLRILHLIAGVIMLVIAGLMAYSIIKNWV